MQYSILLNAIEKDAVAKSVSNYIIRHLRAEGSMSLTHLWSIAKDLAEDEIADPAEHANIVALAVRYIGNDPRVAVAKGLVSYRPT